MADVTISSLPLGTPSGNGVIPFSLGGSTFQAPISGIFQNRPAFGVRNITSQYNKPSGYKMQFRTVDFNIGNHYSTADDSFIVPYTGIYQLCLSVLLNNRNGNYSQVAFFNNRLQNYMGGFDFESNTAVRGLTVSHAYSLQAGDSVYVLWTTDGTYLNIDNSGYFSGYLIG